MVSQNPKNDWFDFVIAVVSFQVQDFLKLTKLNFVEIHQLENVFHVKEEIQWLSTIKNRS